MILEYPNSYIGNSKCFQLTTYTKVRVLVFSIGWQFDILPRLLCCWWELFQPINRGWPITCKGHFYSYEVYYWCGPKKHTNLEFVSDIMKLLVETCCYCQFCIWVKFSIAVPFPDKALHQCTCVLQQNKNIFLYPEDIVGKFNIFMAMHSLLLCGCAAMLTGEVSRFDMSLTMALFHLHQ